MALLSLSLVSEWSRWVHRRVESLVYEDDVTVRRVVSVDFTIPPDLQAPLRIAGATVYTVPIALLRKDVLRKFDIRDELGAALPLLTAPKNGAIAAGILTASAAISPSDADLAGLPRSVPAEIQDDLWLLANGQRGDAERRWAQFSRPRQTDSYAGTEWRRLLGENDDFMALASDLARNFLVLTPLATDGGRRRIVKFSYEQSQEPTERFIRVRSSRGWGQASVRAKVGVRFEPTSEGVGVLSIQATTLRAGDQEIVQDPLDVVVRIKGPSGLEAAVRTGRSGIVAESLPAGFYEIDEEVPAGQLEWDPRHASLYCVLANNEA